MGLFEQFPYTNFHDLNLDWILRLMKQFEGVIEGLDEAIAKEVEKQLNDKDLEEMILDALTRYGLVINVKAPPANLEPASGDGSKDDTITIQGCIDYANDNGGLALFFPSGKYLTQSLNMKSNVTLCGFDRNSTHLVLKGGAINPLISGSVDNVELTGLTFDGNADIQVNNVDLIVLTGGNYYFNNLKLTDGFNLLTLNTTSDVDISNVVFGNAVISALVTNGNGLINASDMRFKSLSALSGLYAIDNKVNRAVFKGIYSTVNTSYAIHNSSNDSVFIGQILNAVNTHINGGSGNYYEFYNRGGTVSELVNAERIDRENADNAEKTERENADNAEKTERENADNAEKTERENADILLQENIENLGTGLSQAIHEESLLRENADNLLRTDLTAETLERQSADTVLQNNIDALTVIVNNIKIAYIPPSTENQLQLLQDCIDNNIEAVLLNGNHVLNGKLMFSTNKRLLKISGCGNAKIVGNLEFDGSLASYLVSTPYVYNVAFSEKVVITKCGPFTWGIFDSCTFENGVKFKGSRHFTFNNCLWRAGSGLIALAIDIDNSQFNGDFNFNSCEFLCEQVFHPYLNTAATPYSEFRGVHFNACIFYGGNGGVYIQLDSSLLRIFEWYFDNCQFDQILANNLFMLNGQNDVKGIKGSFFVDNTTCVFTNQGSVFFRGDNIKDISITNCKSRNADLLFTTLQRAVITGNTFEDISVNGDSVIASLNLIKSSTFTVTNSFTNNNITVV